MRIAQPFLPATLFPEGMGAERPPGPQAPAAPARAFADLVEQLRPGPARQVRKGDTLLAIVREQAAQRGIPLSGAQALLLAQQLARDSGMADANRIFPGQPLAMEALHSRLAALPAGRSAAAPAPLPAAQVLGQGAAAQGPSEVRKGAPPRMALAAYAASGPAAATTAGRPPPAAEAEAGAAAGDVSAGPHPVLERTLDRAVARGFIPAIERKDVYDKILELAARHRFRPDDFARLTLVESDGMNPRASNDRCHGIIQFCDGNDRGAATAGFAANPRAILGFSVYQQLHLVDRYFSEVGVKTSGAGPASLDDLYLAVLMPSARQVTDPQAPLGIPGTQASVLHPGRDRSAPITRQSIQEGLQQYASERLSSQATRLR